MPDLGSLRLGSGAVAPSLQDKEQREAYGLNPDERTPDHYIVELNLMHRGGLEAADAEFRDLFKDVMTPTSPGVKREPILVSKGYYTCLISVEEWRALIRRDERPEDHTRSRPMRDRAIYRIWPDFEVKDQVDRSVATVKADAALRAYAASGTSVVWAVIDSGIDRRHRHFGDPANSAPTCCSTRTYRTSIASSATWRTDAASGRGLGRRCGRPEEPAGAASQARPDGRDGARDARGGDHRRRSRCPGRRRGGDRGRDSLAGLRAQV